MKIPVYLFTCLLAFSSMAYGHFGEGKKHKGGQPEFLQNMSEEERAEFKAIRDKLKSMSKEERQAFRQNVKSKWEALPENEKQAFISENNERIQKALERQKQKVVIRLYGAKILKQQ